MLSIQKLSHSTSEVLTTSIRDHGYAAETAATAAAAETVVGTVSAAVCLDPF